MCDCGTPLLLHHNESWWIATATRFSGGPLGTGEDNCEWNMLLLVAESTNCAAVAAACDIYIPS